MGPEGVKVVSEGTITAGDVGKVFEVTLANVSGVFECFVYVRVHEVMPDGFVRVTGQKQYRNPITGYVSQWELPIAEGPTDLVPFYCRDPHAADVGAVLVGAGMIARIVDITDSVGDHPHCLIAGS